MKKICSVPVRTAPQRSDVSPRIRIENLENNHNISHDTLNKLLLPIATWSQWALEGRATDIPKLFLPNSTFVGTMADRDVTLNVASQANETNPLTHYMNTFLHGLKNIEWLKMNVVPMPSSNQTFYITGSYQFTKETKTIGHYTYILVQQNDGDFKIQHHQSGVKIEGANKIPMPNTAKNVAPYTTIISE